MSCFEYPNIEYLSEYQRDVNSILKTELSVIHWTVQIMPVWLLHRACAAPRWEEVFRREGAAPTVDFQVGNTF